MRKSNRSRSKRGSQKASLGGGFILWSFFFFVILILNFWGRVRIDIKIHENDQLKVDKKHMQDTVNDLRVTVNKMMSYQRIVSLASEGGMVFVSASNQANLYVKTDDWNTLQNDHLILKLKYAGLTGLGIKDYQPGVKKR